MTPKQLSYLYSLIGGLNECYFGKYKVSFRKSEELLEIPANLSSKIITYFVQRKHWSNAWWNYGNSEYYQEEEYEHNKLKKCEKEVENILDNYSNLKCIISIEGKEILL